MRLIPDKEREIVDRLDRLILQGEIAKSFVQNGLLVSDPDSWEQGEWNYRIGDFLIKDLNADTHEPAHS